MFVLKIKNFLYELFIFLGLIFLIIKLQINSKINLIQKINKKIFLIKKTHFNYFLNKSAEKFLSEQNKNNNLKKITLSSNSNTNTNKQIYSTSDDNIMFEAINKFIQTNTQNYNTNDTTNNLIISESSANYLIIMEKSNNQVSKLIIDKIFNKKYKSDNNKIEILSSYINIKTKYENLFSNITNDFHVWCDLAVKNLKSNKLNFFVKFHNEDNGIWIKIFNDKIYKIINHTNIEICEYAERKLEKKSTFIIRHNNQVVLSCGKKITFSNNEYIITKLFSNTNVNSQIINQLKKYTKILLILWISSY